MIEVFKTNVSNHDQAKRLVEQIHASFSGYHANFDLDDCDRILRIKSSSETVNLVALISLLDSLGFRATLLDDHVEIVHESSLRDAPRAAPNG